MSGEIQKSDKKATVFYLTLFLVIVSAGYIWVRFLPVIAPMPSLTKEPPAPSVDASRGVAAVGNAIKSAISDFMAPREVKVVPNN